MVKPGRVILVVLSLVLLVAGGIGWTQYRRARDAYDAYRTLIQQGVKIAGVNVGWNTPEEAREKIWQRVAEPYYRDLTLNYQADVLALSPAEDLGLEIPVDEMVAEAVAASHQYDYWEGFQAWIQGEAFVLDMEVPLEMSFDETAAARHLQEIAQAHDAAPTQPMIDVQKLTFYPGRPGYRLDVAQAASMINEQVPLARRREVELPISVTEPDQSRARIESMLSTLGPVMEREPTLPYYYTATMPISTAGGIEGTPTVDYSGPLTWTFPHFAGYTGPLTETTGLFFAEGDPGYTFNVTRATTQVDLYVRAGMTEPIRFEPDLVPPPPITKDLLLPPLKARLAQFPGVTSILVKNLDTNETIYESNMDYVLSGMSLVKVGIMVEVYRAGEGVVDEESHQLLLSMLGSNSSNPAANFLMASLGGGSAYQGAARVTRTMQGLGLSNFRICAPYVIPDASLGGGQLIWAAWQGASVPRYDRCIRATPREMADLIEMIYRCTEDKGTLRKAYPGIFTPAVCEEMIEVMAANDLRNLLGAGIPPDVKLAHKHGYSGYDQPWGDTRAEVGIVYSPGANWLISFYIWQDTPWINFAINQPLYRDVSNMLYNYFNPQDPFWPRPPWVPTPEVDTG
ncbi:MAG: class A beta-lactamase-related serine hydrolase [Anaerolineae bacterium]|nr:class A beta-lactamase-related serine hydrolase [Anaerolineae bacterium]